MSTGGRRLAYARETLLALVVMALTFLNYGHIAAGAADGYRLAAGDSWCGDPLLPAGADHSPCHVCRLGGGADLPPPPTGLLPVVFVAAPVAYTAPLTLPTLPPAMRPALPRGPPLAV